MKAKRKVAAKPAAVVHSDPVHKLPVGTFLCVGATLEPQVCSMSMTAYLYLTDRLRMTGRCRDPETARAQVYAQMFAAGCEIALPAWSIDALAAVVTDYTGPHKDRLRTIAACILTGVPYHKEYRYDLTEPHRSSDPKGGQQARLDPVRPKPRRPSGGTRLKAVVNASA